MMHRNIKNIFLTISLKWQIVCLCIKKNVNDMFEKTICMGYVYIWICWKPFSQENIIWQVICRRCRHWMLERAYAFVHIINKKRTHDNTQGNEECWNGSHYSYVETINHPKWMCAKPTNIRYLVKNKKGKTKWWREFMI